MNRIGKLFCTLVLACSFACECVQESENLKETTGKTHHEKGKRKLSEIALTADLTRDDVFKIWGAQDANRGSGVDYRAYFLEDGRELWLAFASDPKHRLLRALVMSPATGERELLFGK